jgi:UDP-N-acetylglucosamine 4,6-dehydratase
MNWRNLSVLVTGGTGSFGRKFVEVMLKKYKPKKIIIFSRDEFKQHQMQLEFDDPAIRYFVGDVRDYSRLRRAFDGVDIVVHAAALKQIPSCEYNPFEAVMTNILGAKNVIEAAIDCRVKRIMAISTDKAVNPINLYGATKLCSEKMFVQGNSYVGLKNTRFSCVRYGNVLGSRGGIVELFKRQREKGVVTITDKRMTRFWISLEQGIGFVVKCVEIMQGGEIFIPKLPSMKVVDLAKAVAPECKIKFIGIRPGEKLNECLLTDDEARHALEFKDFFVVEPEFSWWVREKLKKGKPLLEGFRYTSDKNDDWITMEKMRNIIRTI